MVKLIKVFFAFFLIFIINVGINESQNSQKDTIINETEEFKNADEFNEFKKDTISDEYSNIDSLSILAGQSHTDSLGEAKSFNWVIGILLITILAGILVRFKSTRNFRAVFLIASVAILGFYKGACPCPIQSLQYSILSLMGLTYKWQTLIYFLGLIPVTYFLGRIFCGWICHLGALQEFIFLSSRYRILQSLKTQKIMRIIRIIALIALVIQISITQTNLFKKIDPFTIIYNFYSLYILGWILAGIIIISSVFIYRPFCKTLCPIGLILGWISKIPGASVLGVNNDCVSCINCSNSCKINAITHDTKISIIENQECIRCGDCFDSCKKNSISFYFKGKNHEQKTECKSPISH